MEALTYHRDIHRAIANVGSNIFELTVTSVPSNLRIAKTKPYFRGYEDTNKKTCSTILLEWSRWYIAVVKADGSCHIANYMPIGNTKQELSVDTFQADCRGLVTEVVHP